MLNQHLCGRPKKFITSILMRCNIMISPYHDDTQVHNKKRFTWLQSQLTTISHTTEMQGTEQQGNGPGSLQLQALAC